uniref:GRIP domain-containing protein n=1 Tax=Mesocestoides corti TaxID=53468 RepID=A0A5K3ER34_MESCO
MQTQISAEEFARFQSQLLELRQQKYAADESRIRADRRADDLEKTLALQSGEIAELRSSLSRIQRAGDIDALFKENQSLRHRLINIESSFQLQTSTLRAECERLQADNSVLLSTLKTAGLNQTTATSSAHDEGTQTIPIIQTVKASQTLKSGQTSSQVQTDLLSADIENVENRLNELSEADTLLANERLASGRLVKELLERELDVERLERDCEALRSELVVMEKRSDRVQKDLKRQLASAVRAAKQATATPSLSSLVYVQKPPQKCDTISVESFSLCGGVNGVQVMGNDGDMSETSSSSPIPQQTLFSEDDLKGLLNRLSEVQEENCNLRHKVKRLEADLDAKSTIIQQRLTDKAIPYPPVQTNADSSKATPVTNPHSLIPRLASDVLSTVKSKLKQLEAVTMEMSSPTTAVSSVELLGLKRLCEELMTRNISLERALEIALSSGKGNEEI